MLKKPIHFLFLSLFFITPLTFTQSNSELFELPKMYFVYLLTASITIFHLINVFKNQAPLHKKTFLDIPLILFLISQTISTYYSVDPHTSFFGYYSRLNGGLLSLICYSLLYWILAVYIESDLKNKIINYSLFSGFLVSIYAIAQHFGIDKNQWVQDVQSRVFSTFGQPNWLAAYLCILIPLSLYKTFNNQSKINIKYFSLSIMFYISLLFTKSKSGILACLISLAIFFTICLFKHFKTKTSLSREVAPSILGPVGLFILLILLSLAISNPIKDKLFPPRSTSPSTNTENSKILITSSGDIRKIVWQGSIDLWKKFPIFGTGVETFAYTYYWTRPIEHNLTSEWDFLYNKAHNEYLNYLATTGIVGFSTYLVLILFVLYTLIKNSKQNDLSLVILCSYLTILITNTAGFSVVATSLFFFLLPILANTNQEPAQLKPTKSKLRFLIVPSIIFILFFIKNIIFSYMADIAYNQADKYDSADDYQTALSFALASHKLNPSEPVYTDKLSTIYSKLALSTNNQEFVNQAISFSDQTIKISPANINFWKQRAQNYLYLSGVDSKYFSTAIQALTSASKLAPTEPKIMYSLGQFLETASLIDQAIPYYQKAIELKPNYDYAYFALGKIYLNKKEYNLAKENLQKTIDYSYPTNTQAVNFLNEITN